MQGWYSSRTCRHYTPSVTVDCWETWGGGAGVHPRLCCCRARGCQQRLVFAQRAGHRGHGTDTARMLCPGLGTREGLGRLAPRAGQRGLRAARSSWAGLLGASVACQPPPDLGGSRV